MLSWDLGKCVRRGIGQCQRHLSFNLIMSLPSDPLRTLNRGKVQSVCDVRAFECQELLYGWSIGQLRCIWLTHSHPSLFLPWVTSSREIKSEIPTYLTILALDTVMWPSSGQGAIRRCGTESFAKLFSLWGGIWGKVRLLLVAAPPPPFPVLEFCCNVGSWSNHFVVMRPQAQRCKTNTWKMVD